MPPLLFVYGTLRSECKNPYARLLRAHATWLGRARVPGRLYRLWGYPAMRGSRHPEEWVAGELYLLRDPSGLFPLLDRYEGRHHYARLRVRATLEGGRKAMAWAYQWRWNLPESRRIALRGLATWRP